jgi:Protein of unknown function (DUF3108).
MSLGLLLWVLSAASPSPVAELLRSGETIRMEVSYGVLYAGDLVLRSHGVDTVRGKEAVHLSLLAETRSGFRVVYQVADWIHSLMQLDPPATLRYEKDLKEGAYSHRSVVDYFLPDSETDSGRAVYPGSPPETLRTPPFALDPLAVFYAVRLVDSLAVGETLWLPYHVDRRSSRLPVYVERRDTVRTRLGPFPCLVLRPDFQGRNILNTESDLWLWISDDEWRIPVQITTRLFFGTLKARIKDYYPYLVE